MAKKQTRRSISVRGTTYESVRIYCEKHNLSMSEFVEERIATFFGAANNVRPLGRVVTPTAAPTNTVTSTTAAPMKKVANGSGSALKGDELFDAARHFTF